MARARAAPLSPAKSEAFGSRTICIPIMDSRPESMDVWMPCASHEQHSACAACWFIGNWRIPKSGRDTGIGSPTLNLNSLHISRSCVTRSFHWRMRRKLRYSALQIRRNAELLGSPSAWNTRSHRFNAVTKSLEASA